MARRLIFNHMVKYSVDELNRVFAALADPTRRAILGRLAAEGELPVTALAAPFAMSLPAVSKHLRVLERAGLLTQERDGRVRRCQLVAQPLAAAADWIETYRQFWEARLDALADYLAQDLEPGASPPPPTQERSESWKPS